MPVENTADSLGSPVWGLVNLLLLVGLACLLLPGGSRSPLQVRVVGDALWVRRFGESRDPPRMGIGSTIRSGMPATLDGAAGWIVRGLDSRKPQKVWVSWEGRRVALGSLRGEQEAVAVLGLEPGHRVRVRVFRSVVFFWGRDSAREYLLAPGIRILSGPPSGTSENLPWIAHWREGGISFERSWDPAAFFLDFASYLLSHPGPREGLAGVARDRNPFPLSTGSLPVDQLRGWRRELLSSLKGTPQHAALEAWVGHWEALSGRSSQASPATASSS
jgi:hypothetical protein